MAPLSTRSSRCRQPWQEQAKAAGHTAPTVGLTGLPAIEYEEYVNIRKDITLVIFTSAGLIAALILLVVRSVRWAVLIFIPMGLGVLWSLGLALVTVGHLTIITAAFIAILFGLGADYGIFTSSRIAEERRAGKPLVEAIGAGIGSSFVAVLTAGGASLLIFSALATVDFPGFAELGVVAAKGVLMILISTWMVQPALYALLPPKLKNIPSTAAVHTPLPLGEGPGERGRFPIPVAIALVTLAIGGAVFGGVKGLGIPFDYDLLGMLPKDSQAAYYQRRMVAESDYQAEVIIFTATDMAEAHRITSEAGKLKTIAQAQSLTNLFPVDADERLHKAVSIGESFARTDYAEPDRRTRTNGLVRKIIRVIACSAGKWQRHHRRSPGAGILRRTFQTGRESGESAWAAFGHFGQTRRRRRTGQGAQRELFACLAIRSGCRSQNHRHLAAGPTPHPGTVAARSARPLLWR